MLNSYERGRGGNATLAVVEGFLGRPDFSVLCRIRMLAGGSRAEEEGRYCVFRDDDDRLPALNGWSTTMETSTANDGIRARLR